MAEKDTRKILQGVQLHQRDDGSFGSLRTFHPGEEDELEALLSPGQYARLKAEGAIEGDWKPAGKPPLPMSGSKGEKAATLDGEKQQKIAAQLDETTRKRAEAQMAADEKADKALEREQKAYRQDLKGEAARK